MRQLPVLFESQGAALVGTFFRGSDTLEDREPCIVVAGSWLNIKEQMAEGYARALAKCGFTTLVFDYAGWGESGGPLRHVEQPVRKAIDLGSAALFAQAQSYVDSERVGLLGVCASAQYGLRALASGAPFRSFASIAGWFHDAASVAPLYGGARGVSLRLERARQALERYRERGELTMVPAYGPRNDRAGMHVELDYYGDPARGAVAGWKNEMAELSWLQWLPYDGLTPAKAVDTPTLMVHSDGCALPENARFVHERLRGRKQLAWLDGAQTDYYDQPAQMGNAVARAAAWFQETLT